MLCTCCAAATRRFYYCYDIDLNKYRAAKVGERGAGPRACCSWARGMVPYLGYAEGPFPASGNSLAIRLPLS